MTESDLGALSAAVTDVLDNDGDFEEVWNRLGDAIATEPDNAGLRRLRIRLSEAAYDRAAHIADLAALRRIDPADREAWLQLALLQHRWAFLLVDGDDEDDGDEEGDEDLESDARGAENGEVTIQINVRSVDGHGQGAQQEALETQAVRWLTELVRMYRDDADFCVKVFDQWDSANIYSPWLRLRLALDVTATHRNDDRLERVLANAWAELATQAPDNYEEGQPPPVGFLVDLYGSLCDPFMIERAVRCYDALLERLPGDADLLSRRARLRQTMFAFEAAAEDFEAAAEALEVAAAAISDDEEREAMLSESGQLRQQALQCRGGRHALLEGSFGAMDEAMAQLMQSRPAPSGASDELKAQLQEWDRSSRERLSGLSGELDALRDQQAAAANGPSEEQLADLQTRALRISASVAGSLQLKPLNMRPIDPADFEDNWQEHLQSFQQTLQSLGWKFLCWIEWPDFRKAMRHQVVSAVWIDPGSGAVILGSPVGGNTLIDIETELSDGRHLVTTLSRGRNFLSGGPQVDTVFVEPSLPLEDACALHLARVGWTLARSPAASPWHPASFADIVTMQDNGRLAKLRFRQEQGLTDFEALALPNDFPEVFAAMVQQAVREGIEDLNIGAAI